MILIALTSVFALVYLAYGVRTADGVTIGISTLILGISLVAAVLNFRRTPRDEGPRSKVAASYRAQ